MLERLGLEEGEAISHPWVTKAIEKAQARVEGRNFDIRKNILKYDDVMNDQRKVIFEQRLELMDDDSVTETVSGMRHDVVDGLVAKSIPERAYPEQWNTEQLQAAAKTYLGVDIDAKAWAAEEGIDAEIVRERLVDLADKHMASKAARFSPDILRQIEKSILLQSLDGLWREHLVTLDHLSKVVGWRGLAQRDPLNEYKQEAYELFQSLLTNLRELVTTQLAHVEVQMREPEAPQLPTMSEVHIDPATGENEVDDAERPENKVLSEVQLKGVRRNAPCPCGSGKKFKHCHGAF